MQPHCSYLICATPHNGSTLLCEALKNTGIAGWPEEYFEVLEHSAITERPGRYSQPGDEPARSARWGVLASASDLISVLEEGTSCNGVFGAAVMWDSFDDFICRLRHIPSYREMVVLDLLPAAFPNLHYIWFTRRNKVLQAVSLWKAFQKRNLKLDGLHIQTTELTFNFEVIDHLAQQIVADEVDWWRYFDACGIQPFTVVYEELVEAYEATVNEVLQFLQIPLPEKQVLAV